MLKNINKLISSILLGSFMVSNLTVFAIDSNQNIKTNENLNIENDNILLTATSVPIDLSSLELTKTPSFDESLLNVSESTILDLYSYVRLHNTSTDEYTELDKSLIILELEMENPRMGYLDEQSNFIPTKSGEIKGNVMIKGIDSEKASVPIVLTSAVSEEKGSIEIKFIDSTSKESISETQYKVNLKEGDTVDVDAISIDGYKLTSEPKVSVTLEKDNIDKSVSFEYEKIVDNDVKVNLGDVTIKYIDKSSGEEILESVKETNKAFGEYTYKSKEKKGYTVIGDKEKTVILSESNKSVTLTFEYEKEVAEVRGSLTINYVDDETGEKVSESVVVEDLPLGESEHSYLEIKGYRLVGPSSTIKVNITKESLNQTVEFKYAKILKTEVTFNKEELDVFLKSKEGIGIFGNTFILKINHSNLEKISKALKEITVTVLEEPSNRDEVLKLFEENKLEVLDSFSVSSNIKDMSDNMVFELTRQQLNTFEIEKVYLYRVDSKTKSLTLDYVGEGTISEHNAVFKVASKSLDGSTFVITSNKRSTDKVGSINNINSENKDDLPDTSGMSILIKGLSILVIAGSVILIRKKK